jgi:hypothetical protein
MEPCWVRKSRSGLTLIFLHGILSSTETAWMHANGTFWPKLLAAETRLDDHGIYLFSYRADAFSGSYSLDDAVAALREHVRSDGLLSPENTRNGLIFICHSMGGILARRFIVKQVVQLLDSKTPIGLFLVASPSLGSDYANFIGAIAPLYNAQLDILRFSKSNLWLNALDEDFLSVKEQGRLNIVGKELVEDNFIGTNVWLRSRQVVPRYTAARYFGDPVKIAYSDHLSIAKPANANALQHKILVDFIDSFFRRFRPQDSPPPANASANPILVEWPLPVAAGSLPRTRELLSKPVNRRLIIALIATTLAVIGLWLGTTGENRKRTMLIQADPVTRVHFRPAQEAPFPLTATSDIWANSIPTMAFRVSIASRAPEKANIRVVNSTATLQVAKSKHPFVWLYEVVIQARCTNLCREKDAAPFVLAENAQFSAEIMYRTLSEQLTWRQLFSELSDPSNAFADLTVRFQFHTMGAGASSEEIQNTCRIDLSQYQPRFKDKLWKFPPFLSMECLPIQDTERRTR